MKITFTIMMLISCWTEVHAQMGTTATSNKIVKEGKLLYRSEMASWYGTDIFLDKFRSKRSMLGGYFSYMHDNMETCLFFSKGENPKVLETTIFDSTYDVKTAKIDSLERDFNPFERDLFDIRKKTLAEINTDTLFKTYKKTNFNLVPIIENGEKKVYVLTGPEEDGVVIFGNDYLLTFDKNGNILTKRKLHNNILFSNYNDIKKQDSSFGGIHSHISPTSDFITSTDICALMLYEKAAGWKQYYVVSQKYYSIWDCQSNSLTIMTKEAMDRIYDDQAKRHPKN